MTCLFRKISLILSYQMKGNQNFYHHINFTPASCGLFFNVFLYIQIIFVTYENVEMAALVIIKVYKYRKNTGIKLFIYALNIGIFLKVVMYNTNIHVTRYPYYSFCYSEF